MKEVNKMNKHLTFKKYILLAIFVSLMAVLSYLDRLFSGFIIPFIPVIGPILADLKIGVGNLIVLIIIMVLWKEWIKSGKSKKSLNASISQFLIVSILFKDSTKKEFTLSSATFEFLIFCFLNLQNIIILMVN